MNSQLLSELLETLNSEARVYSSILSISKDKTKVIVEGKIAELEKMVKLEQALMLQLGRIEALRESLVEKIASELEIEMSKLTISALIERADTRQAEELSRYQENMTGIIGELKSTNQLNSKLIKNSLEYIDFSMNMLTGTDHLSNNYGSTGTANSSKKRSLLDIKL